VGHAATLKYAENVTHAKTLSGIVIVVFRKRQRIDNQATI
jgi:hypothetical protein